MKFFAIFVICASIYFLYLLFFAAKLGSGYYITDTRPSFIKSEEDKQLELGDILAYDFDDNFIIALRNPVQLFECEDTNPVFYLDKLQYIIINKKNKKIYISYDKNKFEDKKDKLGIGKTITSYRDSLSELKSDTVRKEYVVGHCRDITYKKFNIM